MLYPPITPHRTGLLDVGDGHRIYWEECGNPAGRPVVVLHGGPGGCASARNRRWFHADHFRIITFDQRGCGRSVPHASSDCNTTRHLIADFERLRLTLAVERWMVMGHSWGAALALAFAQTHPDRVDALILASVFTARRASLAAVFPADFVARCHEQLACGERAIELEAAHAWCAREDAVVSPIAVPPRPDDLTALARARIGTHYYRNGYFLEDGQLLANAGQMRGIPGVIVHGRDDRVTPVTEASDLHRAWPTSRVHIVADAGHSTYDAPLARALIDAADSLVSSATLSVAAR